MHFGIQKLTQNYFHTMKTKIIVAAVLFAAIFNSCSSLKYVPDYLPNPEKIDISHYGSYIRVLTSNKTIIQGELIAIDTSNIIVLKDRNFIKEAVSIPIKKVLRFDLRYAKHKHYGWTIPLFALSTIIPFPDPAAGGLMPFHGYLAAITLPINLIVTSVVTRSSETAFVYSEKEMNYEKLKMFARFPQGIPPNIDITHIK